MGIGMGGAGMRPSAGMTGLSSPGLSMLPSSAQMVGGKASNQEFDPEVAKLFGQGLYYSDDGTLYYRGNTDFSEAQVGPGNYDLNPIGLGKYDMLGDNGQSLGTYWGGVDEAINAYALQNWSPSEGAIREGLRASDSDYYGPQQGYYFGGEEGGAPAQWYNTYDAALNALRAQSGVGNYQHRGYWDTAGKLEDWEILGQVMNGDLTNASGFGQSYRHMPGNNRNEYINGDAQMYDSQPLFLDDKLLGYLMDLGPNANDGSQGHLAGYKNDFHISRQDPKGNTRSNYQLYRDIGDPEEWKKHGAFLDEGGRYFVQPEDVASLPGWTQGDVSQYSHKSSGLGGKILGGLGAILSFTPLAPIGMMMSAAGALANGNPLGALLSIAGGAFGSAFGGDFGGGMYGSDLVGNGLSGNGFLSAAEALGGLPGMLASMPDYLNYGFQGLGVGRELSPYLTNMTLRTGANMLQGQDLDDALTGAALGTADDLLGGVAGSALEDAGMGSMAGPLGGAASGAAIGAVRGGSYGAAQGALRGASRGSKPRTKQKEVA